MLHGGGSVVIWSGVAGHSTAADVDAQDIARPIPFEELAAEIGPFGLCLEPDVPEFLFHDAPEMSFGVLEVTEDAVRLDQGKVAAVAKEQLLG